MLRCVDGSYYTGHTDNLESRLAAHDAGALPGYTRDKRPDKRPGYTRFFGEFFDESRSSGTGKADQGLDQAEEGGADSRRLGSFADACQRGWFDGLTTNGYGLTTNGCGSQRSVTVRPEPVEGRAVGAPTSRGGVDHNGAFHEHRRVSE
jgi:hypothetical protein